MPAKGRKKTTSMANANRIDLQSILENLDEKSRRKIDYLLKDFKLRRDHALQEIQESKQHYFNLINAYYDKIPKLAPRRCLDMPCRNFELQNGYLTIDYTKLDRPVQLASSALNRQRNVLKFGGTPAKFKVTYSATKRKSFARSEIKHFEFQRVTGNGQKNSIIVSANKRSGTGRSGGSRKLAGAAMQKTDSSVDEDDQKMMRAMREYQLNKFREVIRHRHADIDSKQKNKRLQELAPHVDRYIDQILVSLTPEQTNSCLNDEEQRALINRLDLNFAI